MTTATTKMPTGPGPHFIDIGNGCHVRAGDYVNGMKKAKAHPTMMFKNAPGGWWDRTGEEIIANFRHYHLNTIINRKAGITFADKDKRDVAYALLVKRIKAGKLTRRCKWCGNGFTPKTVNDRFDDPSCAVSYHN